MKIQLALDRFSIEEAIRITKLASPFIDWVEVGTSLIKEFGVESIISIRKAFPDKVVVADIKTFDSAEYEMNLCFEAGADVATVLGVAPKVTIEKCIHIAKKMNAQVMIDLGAVSLEKQLSLPVDNHVIWCLHVSKDEQEFLNMKQNEIMKTPLDSMSVRPKVAVAGGITAESVLSFKHFLPDVVIVGSYITMAADPKQAAEKLKHAAEQLELKYDE